MAPNTARGRAASQPGLRTGREDQSDLVPWLTARLHKEGLPCLAAEELQLLRQADSFPHEWQRLTGEPPPDALFARIHDRLQNSGRAGSASARGRVTGGEVSGIVFLKAASEGQMQNMSTWLETKERLRLLRTIDEHGRSAVHLAAGAGHTEALRLLYGHGADMDRRDKRGRTPLLLAAEYGWALATEVLLDCGCVPGTADRKGRTALHLAVCCADSQVCRLLVDRSQYLVDRRDVHSRTPLFHSVLNVSPQALADCSRLLLEKRADINARDCYGMVPLHYAAQEDRLAAVQLLLHAKADATVEDRVNGRSPVDVASSQAVRRALEEAVGMRTACADAAAGSVRLAGPFHALQARFIQIMRRVQEGGIQQMEHVKRPHLFTGSWMAPVANHQQLLGQALKYLPGAEVCIRVFNLLYPPPSLPAPRGDEGDILRYFGENLDQAQWGGEDPYAAMAIGPEDAATPAYRGELLRKMQEQRHLLEEKETLIEELRRSLGKMQVQLSDCIEPETAKVLRARAAKAQAELLSVSEDLQFARNKAAELEGQNRVLQEKLDEEKARGDALLADHLALRRQLDDELMRRGEEQSWHLLYEKEQEKAAELERRLQSGETDAASRASSVAMLQGEIQRLKMDLVRQASSAEENLNAEKRRQQQSEQRLRQQLESAQQDTAQQAAVREAQAMQRQRDAEAKADALRKDMEKADRLRLEAEKALSGSKAETKDAQTKLASRDQHWQSMIDKYPMVANMLMTKNSGAASAGAGSQATTAPVQPQVAAASASPTKKVWVTIVSARGLRDADSMPGMGTSDPYCICSIPGKPKAKRIQTKTLDNTVTPVWNHTDVLDAYQDGDALEFEVKDSDTAKFDDLLGKVRLSPEYIAKGFDGELPLSDAGKGITAYLRVQVTLVPPGAGTTAESTMKATPTKKVYVTIVSARGLRDADSMIGTGTSDPYCICSIPGKPKLKKIQTKTLDNTVTPAWNHSDVMDGYQDGDALEFEVKDSDTGSFDDVLGKVRLTPEHIAKGFDGELPLAEAGKGIEAYLRVQVSLAPPGAGSKPNTVVKQIPTKKVYVTIVSARGLRDADSMIGTGTSDPYCICSIPGKPKLKKIQTKTLDNTVTPVWNHSDVMDGYQDGDALEFEVKDSDTGSFDDVLGKVRLSPDKVAQGFDGELQLIEAGKGIEAFLKVQVSLLPPGSGQKPAATAQPVQTLPPKKIWVTIVSARGLRDADSMIGTGTSDPYCICSIAGKQKLKKIQTKTLDNTVTPVWNHSEVMDGYQDGDALEFEVKDSDTGKFDDLLGKARLPAEYIAPKASTGGFDGELPLTDAGKGIQAFLRVQVSLTPPGAAAAPPAAGTAPAAQPKSAGAATGAPTPSPAPLKKVYVYVASARGLRDADTMMGQGTSDPYCICSIGGKPKAKIQTKTLDNTVTPVWNHSGELDSYQDGDTLEFEVRDSDVGKTDDLLGKVTLSPAEVAQGFDGEKQLADAGNGISAFIRVKVSMQPITAPPTADAKAKSSAAPAPKATAKAGESKQPGATGHTVHLTIVSANGLRDADAMLGQGTSDPYCVCSIVGQPQTDKKRTKTVNNNANPVWNESFTLVGVQEGSSLLFELYDEDTGKTDDFLGRASLDWLYISKRYEGKLTLLDAGKGVNATLEVRVSCDVPASGPPPQQPPPGATSGGPSAAVVAAAPPKAAAAVGQQPASSTTPPAKADPPAVVQQPGSSSSTAPPAKAAPPPQATTPPAAEAAKRTQKVRVKVTKANNLWNADWMGKSDPYCVVEIAGKASSKLKTPVVDNNLDPVWNFEGILDDFEEGNTLVFNVFDDDSGMKQVAKSGDDHLGKAELSSAQVLAGFSGPLNLEPKDKKQATITVSVQVER